MRNIIILSVAIFVFACKGENQQEKEHQYTNKLIHETSPYLLQHAHNPVDWHAWNDKTLKKAKQEDKLMVISVGYSACHWCHVMEHESFEDSLVAQVMNEHFVNIKVDREERPDVDQTYMNALYLLNNGNGGWPLNIVALPDGRPIWGSTYLPKEQWMSALKQLSNLYKENPDKLLEQANNIQKGVESFDMIALNTEAPVFEITDIENAVKKWSTRFDNQFGGLRSTQKFMMPNNYHFLLRYAHQNKDDDLLEFINLTLTKMAYGGIFDQVGGGFSRYSVDEKWHVPHFEKMLYDNAQLVSLYVDAYLLTKNNLYQQTVQETLAFVKSELTTQEGAFLASLDADSMNETGELEEGAYYIWTKEELQTLITQDFDLFSDYYNINNFGFWEKGHYVLIRKAHDEDLANKYHITQKELHETVKNWKLILKDARSKREKPRLDDKILTSWNGLMLKGYVDAYRVFNNTEYIETALKNAHFIKQKLIREDGGLNHTYKEGTSKINGYLEDYATVIDAFISLYEVTIDENWLNTANLLMQYTFNHFYDDARKMFYFTSNEDNALISRNIEYRDNVIPASNSIMAKNLFKLSHYFDNTDYTKTAETMLNNVKPEMQEYPSAYSNWYDLMLTYAKPFYEVAIVGNDALNKINKLNKTYIPNKLIAGSTQENSMPLLENRYNPEKTLIYVCVNKACKLPVSEVDDAIKLIKQ
ncbi:thioredoxin domain-containing protein [Tamlana fucoidanivorans]|uniref:Thioredoxin domain-containing protein n=1 Tax=Allotamlana fucoidanivorans TaxID=2583814 RepID=A0A5C4SEQ3_9FLAO|nr:thioredoxin domain-containing protein [Tamlana fucoidanivorans]TNJ41917.1 thioredoxin domain-containing protein [Tamlana fucoidanivorans]